MRRKRRPSDGRLLFFLEEKTVGLRGKRRPSDGRLLFFLEEKKQKKIICGEAFFLRSCCFRQRATQNGRFVCEPSVFILQAECAGKHLFSDKSSIPQCLLFLFFKKRKRPPLPFLSRKKRKQKKVECGKAFFRRSCCFRQRATQNGRFVCEPSVFILQAECAGKHLFSDKSSIPQCLLFLFFKKRNRSPKSSA